MTFVQKFHLKLPAFALITVLCLICSACSNFILVSSGNGLVDTQHGKRTLGSRIEDQSIETKTLINIKNSVSNSTFNKSRIVVVSFNGYVLLSGQTQSTELKRKAGDVAKEIRHVERVYNEIEISRPISAFKQLNDSWITSKVKTSLFLNKNFPSSHTKIISENGTVFLMGLLTESESNRAIKIIKKNSGVQKIVRIVEYID